MLEKHNQQTSSKPEIGKVPCTLREIKSNENCFDPSVVALGPYHHDDEHLKPMENYKKEVACWFVKLLACSVQPIMFAAVRYWRRNLTGKMCSGRKLVFGLQERCTNLQECIFFPKLDFSLTPDPGAFRVS